MKLVANSNSAAQSYTSLAHEYRSQKGDHVGERNGLNKFTYTYFVVELILKLLRLKNSIKYSISSEARAGSLSTAFNHFPPKWCFHFNFVSYRMYTVLKMKLTNASQRKK